MPTIARPHHMGIQVADLERSLRFYRDILGFEVVFQWNPQAEYIRTITGYPDADIHAAILACPAIPACSWRSWSTATSKRRPSIPGPRTPAPPTSRSSPMTATACTPSWWPRVCRRCRRRSRPPSGPNTGGRAVYMIDPDGIRVEFITSRLTFDGKPNQ